MNARHLVAGLATLALAAPLLAVGSSAPVEEKAKTFAIGKEVAADITLTDIDGKVHKFSDYRGKTVVIDFWSCQCPYAVAWEQKLVDLHKKYKDKDVVFLAINSNKTEVDKGAEDPYGRIRKYAKKSKITYPVLIDEGNVIADRFVAKTTPHTYVIDKKGMLRYAGAIDNDRSFKKPLAKAEIEPWLDEAIAAVVAGKEVPQKTTKPVGCSIKRVKRADL